MLELAYKTMVEGITAQGKLAIDPVTGRFNFRTACGLKCAVGQLVPDWLYDPEMDEFGSMTAVRAVASSFNLPLDFVLDMQRAHDNAGSFEDFFPRAQEVAQRWKIPHG